jgi:hypothetical protein
MSDWGRRCAYRDLEVGNLKELGVDGTIVLELIFKKWDGRLHRRLF